jgi:hypothetical protein
MKYSVFMMLLLAASSFGISGTYLQAEAETQLQSPPEVVEVQILPLPPPTGMPPIDLPGLPPVPPPSPQQQSSDGR